MVTNFGFTALWTITGLCRDRYLQLFYVILAKTGFFYLTNYMHDMLSQRVIAQMEAAGYQRTEEIPIPEFDWQNKTAEEFYQTFAQMKHPVILRGFMNNSALLKELSWESLMKKFADENVFLTSLEVDGYEGKLKEVNESGTYLHNSELIFMKYPEVRNLFEYEKLEPYLRMKIGYVYCNKSRFLTFTLLDLLTNYEFWTAIIVCF